MHKKYIFIILSCFSLFLGGAVYLLYRENVIISIFVEQFIDLSRIRALRPFPESIFINGYLCDYLWMFSFTSSFAFLFYEERRKWLAYTFNFLCGVFWEIAQLKSLVSGAFDFLDVLTYLTAVFSVVLIDKKLKEKKI